jgi:hypothetical protein
MCSFYLFGSTWIFKYQNTEIQDDINGLELRQIMFLLIGKLAYEVQYEVAH